MSIANFESPKSENVGKRKGEHRGARLKGMAGWKFICLCFAFRVRVLANNLWLRRVHSVRYPESIPGLCLVLGIPLCYRPCRLADPSRSLSAPFHTPVVEAAQEPLISALWRAPARPMSPSSPEAGRIIGLTNRIDHD